MNVSIWTILFVASLYLLLAVITGVVYFKLTKPSPRGVEQLTYLQNKWIVLVLLTIAWLIHHSVATLLFAIISFIALKEFITLSDLKLKPTIRYLLYAIVPVQFIIAQSLDYPLFLLFIPVYLFLFMPLLLLSNQQANEIMPKMLMTQWGIVFTIFVISHAAFLTALPDKYMGMMSGGSLLFYVVFLIEVNYLAQLLGDKWLGKQYLLPEIHPKYTREGSVIALIASMLFAILVGAMLTVFSWQMNLIFGLIISLLSLAGQMTLPAIEKLFGMGAKVTTPPRYGYVLNKLNGLAFTLPLFVYLVYSIYY